MKDFFLEVGLLYYLFAIKKFLSIFSINPVFCAHLQGLGASLYNSFQSFFQSFSPSGTILILDKAGPSGILVTYILIYILRFYSQDPSNESPPPFFSPP